MGYNWYVWTILACYLLSPLLLHLIQKWGGYCFLACIVITGFIKWILHSTDINDIIKDVNFLNYYVGTLALPRFPAFVLGMTVAHILQAGNCMGWFDFRKYVWLLSLAIPVLMRLQIADLLPIGIIPRDWVLKLHEWQFYLLLPALPSLYVLAGKLGCYVEGKFKVVYSLLLSIGECSFELYLLHIWFFANAICILGLYPTATRGAVYLLLISLVCSVLLARLVRIICKHIERILR